jgi:hypothetical protein
MLHGKGIGRVLGRIGDDERRSVFELICMSVNEIIFMENLLIVNSVFEIGGGRDVIGKVPMVHVRCSEDGIVIERFMINCRINAVIEIKGNWRFQRIG